MNNETKLKKAIEWLDGQGVEYKIPKSAGRYAHSDLCIVSLHIFIKIEGDDDRDFYWRHRHHHPIFIRSNETVEYVIEKIHNTIVRVMLEEQDILIRKMEKKERKKKLDEEIAARKAEKARRAEQRRLNREMKKQARLKQIEKKSWQRSQPKKKRKRIRIGEYEYEHVTTQKI